MRDEKIQKQIDNSGPNFFIVILHSSLVNAPCLCKLGKTVLFALEQWC